MNLVGELMIARSRLDRRLAQLDQVSELLLASRTRLAQAGATSSSDARAHDPAPPRSGSDRDDAGAMPGHLGALRRARVRPLRRLQYPGPQRDRDVGRRRRGPEPARGPSPQHPGGHRPDPAPDRGPPQGDHPRAHGAHRAALRARGPAGPGGGARHREGGDPHARRRDGRGGQRDHRADRRSAPAPHPERRRPRHRARGGARAPRASPPGPRDAVARPSRAASSWSRWRTTAAGWTPTCCAGARCEQGFLPAAEAAALLRRGEALNLIFVPGFSTAAAVTRPPGGGSGWTWCATNVSRLNGEIDVETEAGRVHPVRPQAAAHGGIAGRPAGAVRAAETFAVPAAPRCARSSRCAPTRSCGRAAARRVWSKRRTSSWFASTGCSACPRRRRPRGCRCSWCARAAASPSAVAVDELVGKEEIVIKNLGGLLERVGPVRGRHDLRRGAGHPARGSVAPRRGRGGLRAAARTPALARSARARAGGRTRASCSWTIRSASASSSGRCWRRRASRCSRPIDGAEALRAARRQTVDVVITDLEMPRVNGYELIEDLRAAADDARGAGGGADHAGGRQARGPRPAPRHRALRRQAGGRGASFASSCR